MILNEFYTKPLQEVLTEMDLLDVKVHADDNGKIASIELKYGEKPSEVADKRKDARFGVKTNVF